MSHLQDWGRSENPAAPEVVSQPHSTPSRPLLRNRQEKVLLGNLLPRPTRLSCPPAQNGEANQWNWRGELKMCFCSLWWSGCSGVGLL